MPKYNWKITAQKGLKYLILFGIPALINWVIVEYPQYMQLTLGGVLVMLANYLKVRIGLRLP